MTAKDAGPICFVESSSIDIEEMIDSAGGPPEFKASLREASVLLLPAKLSNKDIRPAFPSGTPQILRMLRRDLGDKITVDAALHDDNYIEIGFRSIDVFLPVIYVAESVLLPLVISTIGSYIANSRKGTRGKTERGNIKSEIIFKGRTCGEFSIKYEGPADTYKEVNLQQIRELGALLDAENPEDLDEDDEST